MRKKIGRRALKAECLETRALLAGDVANMGAAIEDRVASFYEESDANVDGELTADEVSEKAWTRVSAADADASGGVSQVELVAQITERFEQRAERGGGHGRRGHGRHGHDKTDSGEERAERTPEEIAERIASVVDRVFSKADADGDGALSGDELTGRRAEKLVAADADGDGSVTKDELTTAIENRIAERQAEKEDDDSDSDDVSDTDGGDTDGGETNPEPAEAVAEVTSDRLSNVRSLASRGAGGFRAARSLRIRG